MKKQLLTFLLMVTTVICFGQKTDTAIFKGATKIIIKNANTAEDNYKLAGQLLLDNGYTIGNKDAEFFQISSEPVKVVGQGSTRALVIYAISKDNQVTIIGKSKNLSTLQVVEWSKNESSPEIMPYSRTKIISKAIYYKLSEYAKAFKSNSITYSE